MHVTIYVDAEAAFMGAVAALGRDGNRTEAISRLLLWCAAQTKPVIDAVLRSGAGATSDDVAALRRQVSFDPVPQTAKLHVHRRVPGGTMKTASLPVAMPEEAHGFGPVAKRRRKGGDPPAKEDRSAPRKAG